MRQRFREWLQSIAADRKNASHPSVWVVSGAFVVALLAFASFVPGVRESFQLPFAKAVACFAPAFVFGLVGGTLEHRGRLSLAAFGLLSLVGAALFHFFGAATVVLARPPGAWVMAGLTVVLVAMHGYIHRVSFRHPYGAVGSLVAMAAAAPLDPSAAPRLAITAFAAIGASLLLGIVSLRTDQLKRRQEALRAALQAQLLEESARDRNRLTTLLQRNHDANNVLSSVFLQSQLLEERTRWDTLEKQDLATVQRRVAGVTEGLARLKELLEAASGEGEDPARLEAVEVDFALEQVLAEVSALHPEVSLSVRDARDMLGLSVPIAGGRLALHRVLENILLNACEGDGTRGASTVEVSAREDRGEGVLRLVFADDGPGFPESQLGGPIQAFETTKLDGTGLGLLTAQRLLYASGGSLERANRPEGGARVEVRLALAPWR